MYVERINRTINKINETNEKEDYNILLNSLFDYLYGSESIITADDILRQKIKNLNIKNRTDYNYLKIRLNQILDSLKLFYRKELEALNNQIKVLIENQKYLNSLIESIDEEKMKKLVLQVKRILDYKGNEVIEDYSELIEVLESRINNISKNVEDFKVNKDLHIVKLLLYNIYFEIKILEEDYRKYKEKINKKIEIINKRTDYLLLKLQEKLNRIEKDNFMESKSNEHKNLFDDFQF